MLPTPPQADAGAGVGGEEEFATEFHNWAVKGAADLILPELEENSDDDEDTGDDHGDGDDFDDDDGAQAQSPPPSKESANAATEGGKIAYITEAKLEAMIQARLDSQLASLVDKALSAKMVEIMKMNDGSKKREGTPPKEKTNRVDREVEG